ncbi:MULTISPECIES: ABC transporter ATP-binding protein [unclassified Paenibacillus]|uniref:ABC transporter ATP-binding protein n=1 Tax=unclassified Paenibacillus TaxID=185978 RepID=UPI001AEA637D|nr:MULTISPECIES: ABC transporter ATP-binding protein [unclassified Paenibacillus]MBP1156572.1 iron complex transport system ATP-binding protein [Paenibacillus sp. PvP091]MBP1172690.1 iron complex transport system ATP-binding protein [Paenibacillus sp. PvR098]MBP2439070.1 iron complex transport system ATP-binding protein [Paenibacillus sp. PvP052]
MSQDFAIEVKDLSYLRDDKVLLSGIHWRVRKGEHWALLGLNGSGKTTLLNMITGYLWPTKGEINVLGETYGSVDLREMRKLIGWVSSSLQEKLYASDKAQVVVLSGKYATIGLYDKPEAKDFDQASELMHRLGCSHLWDRAYQTCSQGEKQKLLIARALMANPRLLILDEPCNGLDLFAREQLLSGIAGLAGQPDAPTMLYVTHHTEEILPVFTHALLLRRGSMFASGETGKLLTDDTLSAFYELPVEVRSRNGRAWLSIV